HALQQRQALLALLGLGTEIRRDGRAEAAPARQRDAALAPAEAPRDRPQVLDRAGGLARGRARADVQLGDLADRRGAEEVVGEAGRAVDELAVGLVARVAERSGSVEKALR